VIDLGRAKDRARRANARERLHITAKFFDF